MYLGLVAGAFGLGASLGILPGPVQFVLLSESTRGGARRGFAAMAGANGTMGLLLLLLAAGVAAVSPGPTALRALRIVGGIFLLYLSADAFRVGLRGADAEVSEGGFHVTQRPLVRGSMSVLLNPGVWIFLATTAAALFATAEHDGGRWLAAGTAVAMLFGVAIVDGSMVMLGDRVRRFERSVVRYFTPVLAVALGAFGTLLLAQGIFG